MLSIFLPVVVGVVVAAVSIWLGVAGWIAVSVGAVIVIILLVLFN